MPNLIPNNSGLEGTGWTGGVVTVDETVRGSPGRAVTTIAAGANIATPTFAVVAGGKVYVFAHHRPGRTLLLRTNNGGGGAYTEQLIPRLTNPSGPHGRRGVPNTFALSKGVMTVPAGHVSASLISYGAAPNYMLKPFASTAGFRCWTPGPHTNPDLDLAVWPDTLPDIREVDSPRTPTRKGFSTDSGIPASWRIGTRGRILFEGELRLSLEERDTLDQFFEARLLLQESAPFWFVHPDTRALCRAWFNPDVELSDSGRGRDRVTRLGLVLEIA